MDKGSRQLRFPWLFPSRPRLRALTLIVASAAVAGVAAYGALRTLADFGIQFNFDGSDDRPPIIISNGSLYFDGGDAVHDSPTLKQNWRDWEQDVFSDHWKPALSSGKNVNRYDVTVSTATDKTCGPLHGRIISVEYTRTDGITPSPVSFTLNTHPWAGFARIEPKLEPNGISLDVTAVARDASGAPTAPSRLTFQAKGYISSLTVSNQKAGKADCTFIEADNPTITVVQFDK